ncbi:AraC family transcriptional regulator [Mangrovimicrobium sediminis]|uniref:AraC family transcriptional regulator n=1 Tax=Mangrovimicrobium sediminis TaxID=2562682 RepID=A0A4Z0LVU9_9GAMM|nr:AraC family transcriptional regulator [Haliea sp. SAOS-164]TGD71354.1 AraC family transcriptional regulator [Haliea sp. SAOS-164]
MSETLFVLDKRNYRECQDAYRGNNNQEYYLGDYSIDTGSVIDVRAEKKAVGSCSIIHIKSRTKQSFMRSWSHIREDATDVVVLWFVKRGRLCISHQSGSSVAEAGDFAITKSMTPFSIDCQTDDESVHEVMHVIVPTHILRRFIPQEVRAGFAVPGSGRAFAIAESILSEVFNDRDELSDHVQQLLVESALQVVADAIKDREDCTLVRQSLPDKRLQEVLRYIEIHLSDPGLSTAMVAEACGISQRYLSFLLKQNGTPFSELVWDKRLKIASRWLSSSRPSDISIAEIAFRVGFKSPAHFSRMFKRVYNKGPREYRSASLESRPSLEGLPDMHQELFTGGSSSTLQ